ncbi:redoxin domain-containing protein [Candidatus Sumerlaeota bacterium]|nr:redoxin domain-containing protein [Candidatus Sumerlaeota bacterium]
MYQYQRTVLVCLLAFAFMAGTAAIQINAGEEAGCCISAGASGEKTVCPMTGGAKGAMAACEGCEAESCDGCSLCPYNLGSVVSDFTLPSGKAGSEGDFAALTSDAAATVVIFWNQDCPYVREAKDRILRFNSDYKGKKVAMVAINSGEKVGDEQIHEYAESFPLPLLIDRDGAVGKRFSATKTPQAYVLDENKTLVYRGAFDSGKNRTESGELERYVQNAVDSLLAGEKIAKAETKAFGCGITYPQ